MKAIDLQTRSRTAKTSAACVILFAVPAMQISFFHHLRVPLGLATLLLFSSLISFLPFVVAPFVIATNGKSAEKKLRERAQRLEAYRASPQSHILHLND